MYTHRTLDSVFCYFIAFGVAHQALEEIEPSNETVLIIGNCLVCIVSHILSLV